MIKKIEITNYENLNECLIVINLDNARIKDNNFIVELTNLLNKYEQRNIKEFK